MKMIVIPLLSSLFFLSAVFAQEWSDPKFLPPDSTSPGNVEFASTEDGGSAAFDEEVQEQITLAKINYNGDIEPKLTIYPTPSYNSLGAAVEKREGEWVLVVNARQDFETAYNKNVIILVAIGQQHSVFVTYLKDINDNPPVLNLYPTFWSVYENWLGDSDFIIKVNDPDVSCQDFQVNIYDSGVVTDLFTTEYRQGEACNKMLAFMVTKKLDYETQNWYNLTFEVIDGPWKVTMEKRLNVWDDWN